MKSTLIKSIVIALVFLITPLSFATEDQLAAQVYNELGAKAFIDGAIEAAISYFEQAHRLDKGNETIKRNLAASYCAQAEIKYTMRNSEEAEKYLNAALEKDPKNVNALFLLGEIKYLSQKMDEAKKLWNKVLEVDPDNEHAGEIKEKLAKLDKEIKVEKDYRSTRTGQFDIRYPRGEERLSYNLGYYLREAYRLVGQDFECYPGDQIIVLVYDKKDFETIEESEKEQIKSAIGIYDGKIRLPLLNIDLSNDQIRAVIVHEYTHLVVEYISKDLAPRWLGEGLAQYEESRYFKRSFWQLEEAVDDAKLIPLAELDLILLDQTDQKQYYIAYQQSYTLVNFLMKKYNRYKIRKVLERLGEGEPFESVAKFELHLPVKELEKRWLKELKAGKLY